MENTRTAGSVPSNVPDLDALREKAEKATPGPWLKGDNYLIGGWWVIAPDKPAREDCHRTIADLFIRGEDATYVAAVSPDVLLAILAENERLRKYARHLPGCRMERILGPSECSCGLTDALAGPPAENKEARS